MALDWLQEVNRVLDRYDITPVLTDQELAAQSFRDMIVRPSVFVNMFNLFAIDSSQPFGHVQLVPGTANTWSGWTHEQDDDEFQGEWASFEIALWAMSVLCPSVPEWPTVDQDSVTTSGDLSSIIQEAYDWAEDCGLHTRHLGPKTALGYVERAYEGGLFGFVLDTQPLW